MDNKCLGINSVNSQMLSDQFRMSSFEQVSSNYFEIGQMLSNQQNNHNQMMCLERRVSLNAVTMLNNRNASLHQQTPHTAPSPTPVSSMYWNEEAANPQHRALDRSQSLPCNRTTPNVNSSRYKTELCRPFEEKGYCKYSDKCQFAHGEHELKNISRHPKYKTDLCHKYHTDGFCGYGTRCNFIHNENERQLDKISTKNQEALIVQQQRKHEAIKRGFPGPIQRPSSIMFNRPASSLSDSSPRSSDGSPSLSPTFFDADDATSYMNMQPSRLSHECLYRNNNNSPLSNATMSDNVSQLAMSDNVSQLADMTNLLAPLYIQTHLYNNDYPTMSHMNTQNIHHYNTQLNNQHNDNLLDMTELATELSDIVSQPHSPPDSISGDSLSSSGSSGSLDFTGIHGCPSPDFTLASSRLPIFAQIGPQFT